MKVGYIRVSTREQSETDALEQQLARVKKAGAARIFQDVESGKKDSRSQFKQMLELARLGEIKEIVITRIDRLSRSVISLHKTMKQLDEWGVKLTILDAPVDDPNSPFGWFSISQMGQLAEFESRLLSSRIRHGINYFREQKKAAPRPPFGYARINEKYEPDLTINEKSGLTNWEVAQKLVEHFLSPGATTRGSINYCLQEFDVKWTAAGFRYWLLNPTMRGNTCYNVHGNQNNPEKWIIHADTHQPLISEETLIRIKQRFEENRHKYSYGNNRDGTNQVPLQSLMTCGCCGYKLFVIKASKYKTYRVRCKKRETLGSQFCSYQKSIRLHQVMEAVDKKLIKKAEQITKRTEKGLIAKKTTNPQIAKLQNQLNSLKQLPSSDIIDEAIKQTEKEIGQLINQVEITGILEEKQLEIIQNTLNNPEYWDSLAWVDKIIVYKQLVNNVVILNGEVLEISLFV